MCHWQLEEEAHWETSPFLLCFSLSLFPLCPQRQNKMHEVLRLCDKTPWRPQHRNGHGGKSCSFVVIWYIENYFDSRGFRLMPSVTSVCRGILALNTASSKTQKLIQSQHYSDIVMRQCCGLSSQVAMWFGHDGIYRIKFECTMYACCHI